MLSGHNQHKWPSRAIYFGVWPKAMRGFNLLQVTSKIGPSTGYPNA